MKIYQISNEKVFKEMGTSKDGLY